jgi:predicted RNA-binding Zn-ribbon protein involved in translation (DUF1610 family)
MTDKPADFTPTRCPRCGDPLTDRRCDACRLTLIPNTEDAP